MLSTTCKPQNNRAGRRAEGGGQRERWCTWTGREAPETQAHLQRRKHSSGLGAGEVVERGGREGFQGGSGNL